MFGEYAEMVAVARARPVLRRWHRRCRPPGRGAGTRADMAAGPAWPHVQRAALADRRGLLLRLRPDLRWTLPRIRIDQVMYTCIQVLLPLALVILLGNTFWGLWVRNGSGLAIGANVVLSALGVILMAGFVWFVAYGFLNRRALVGTLAVDHLPGA